MPGSGRAFVLPEGNATRKKRGYALSKGERLRIERFRKGVDQHVAAAALGVSREHYQVLEKAADDVRRMALYPHEWCRILRTRARVSQRVLAEKLGLTRNWVNRMECGLEHCDTLLEYWENHDRTRIDRRNT